MNLTLCLGLVASAVGLAGCSATGESVATRAPGVVGGVALAALGPSASGPARDGVFFLGAGDALGQEIFTYYVATLRLEELYATGEGAFLEDE